MLLLHFYSDFNFIPTLVSVRFICASEFFLCGSNIIAGQNYVHTPIISSQRFL